MSVDYFVFEECNRIFFGVKKHFRSIENYGRLIKVYTKEKKKEKLFVQIIKLEFKRKDRQKKQRENGEFKSLLGEFCANPLRRLLPRSDVLLPPI